MTVTHHHPAPMAGRFVGQRVARKEDPRLLTGHGEYVDDIQLPHMLHAAFVRSPFARARIARIDTRLGYRHDLVGCRTKLGSSGMNVGGVTRS